MKNPCNPSSFGRGAGLVLTGLLVVLLLGLAWPRAGLALMDDQGLVVARVEYADAAEKNRLAAEFPVLTVRIEEKVIELLLDAEQVEALRARGYSVNVDEERSAAMRAPAGYPCYRAPDEIEAQLKGFAASYPHLCELADIGDSWDKVNAGGGHDIWKLRLTRMDEAAARGDGLSGRPILFVMANIHAVELISSEAAMRFVEWLLHGYGRDPEATWILDNREVHVVPMVNPDGRMKVENGLYWRKNTNSLDGCAARRQYGVDLNRNFDTNWAGPGTSGDPCVYNYHGSAAASEPETQALVQTIGKLFPNPADDTGLLLTLHSYGHYVLWPWGNGYTASGLLPKDKPGLEALGHRFAQDNGYTNMIADDFYYAAGATEDWAYEHLDIAGYTFEMGTDQPTPCDQIDEDIDNNIKAFIYAAKAAGPDPYEVTRGPDVSNLETPAWWLEPGQPLVVTATADDTATGWIADANFPTITPDRGRDIASATATLGESTVQAAAVDGAFDAVAETLRVQLDTSGLASGRQLVSIQATDDQGRQGAPSSLMAFVAPSLANWWYEPPGNGIAHAIEIDSQYAYVAVTAYDDEGEPRWWSCLASRQSANRWAGPLMRFSGSALGRTRNSQRYSGEQQGQLELTLTGPASAHLSYTLNGQSIERDIETYLDGLFALPYAWRDENGWWGVKDGDGQGLFLETQGDTLFAVLYNYDAQGAPEWWILGGDPGGFPEGSTEYVGALSRWRGGSRPDGTAGPGLSGETLSDQARLTFLSGEDATLSWGATTIQLGRFRLF